jgi:hypothetical protein
MLVKKVEEYLKLEQWIDWMFEKFIAILETHSNNISSDESAKERWTK